MLFLWPDSSPSSVVAVFSCALRVSLSALPSPSDSFLLLSTLSLIGLADSSGSISSLLLCVLLCLSVSSGCSRDSSRCSLPSVVLAFPVGC